MRNVRVGAVAAIVLSAGLVAVPSHAADTQLAIAAVAVPKAVGKPSIIRAKVSRVFSGQSLQGRTVLTVMGAKGPAAEDDVVIVRRKKLDDRGVVRFRVRFPQPGQYWYTVDYTSQGATDAEDISVRAAGSFRVKRT